MVRAFLLPNPRDHFPAAETRFFLMLPEVLEGNIRKRAQTISASGLVGNCLTSNQLSQHKLLND